MNEINTKKIESVDSVTVSSGVLADLFSLTDKRVRQLSEEGILVKVKRGRYSLADSVKNYIIHIKTNQDIQDSKNEAELDLEKEKALHEKTKREITELKLAAMRGEMHHS
ncbi:hypothetical protein [Clostridium formicaceticum]|uniref:Uncharacterized protein n=1 Tax=Clostridium formicaceticum TaxID=1497 RepID=A0AAC9WFY8_9CLOT|nr:hypothetical protein [Clostridium formicaceticum]AOY76791.1 hypothetical protein BJL90_13575 [Clostridium formicaceticum]ARE87256.1 hypothetical protein CLFO_16550 [Clostridium formicaceticum]